MSETKKDDGGPAFPRAPFHGIAKGNGFPDTEYFIRGSAGLSLWDYYAAHAPYTIADVPSQRFSKGTYWDLTSEERHRGLATLNAVYADAMLAERKKRFEG